MFTVPVTGTGVERREGVGGEAVVGRRAHQRRPDAAELFRAGVDVDEAVGRVVAGEQGVALGRVLAEAGADGDQEVGVLRALHQLRIAAEPEVAGIVAAVVRQDVLAPERQGDGQAQTLGPVADGGGRLVGPARAAENQERAFGLGKALAQIGEEGGV